MAATLVYRLTGGSANSDPDSSLGGVMSSEALAETALNNLFDDVEPSESSAGDTEYRALDVYNSGDATAESVAIYMSTATSSSDSVLHIGHDATNNPHTTAWDGETIANESTAPASPTITFAERTSGSKLSLPNIPSGQAARVWFKRIISASAGNTANDLGTLAVDYA